MLVLMTALNYYHQHRQQVLKVLDPSDHVVDNIRKAHFERVLDNFDMGILNKRDRIDQVATLECLHEYVDLFLAHPKMLQSESFSVF